MTCGTELGRSETRGAELRRLSRATLLATAALVAAIGLVWNFAPLPRFARHYGGSLLGGGMVLLILAASRPAGVPSWAALGASMVLSLAVELLRLVHFPLLDEWRATFIGGLLLGRVYNPWNVAAYWVGAMIAWIVTCRSAVAQAPASSSRRSTMPR